MKQLAKIFFLLTYVFSQNFEEDIAYKLVLEKLNGSIPSAFVREAFSHDKLEIHKVIAERFAKPYEKKAWTEYRKIFVKESRISAGAKFFSENTVKSMLGWSDYEIGKSGRITSPMFYNSQSDKYDLKFQY